MMFRIGRVGASQVQEVKWSDLQRDPTRVGEIAVEGGDVRVIRRDGVNLILTREDRVLRGGAGALLAARAIRRLAAGLPVDGMVAEAIVEEFPWVLELPKAEIPAFIH